MITILTEETIVYETHTTNHYDRPEMRQRIFQLCLRIRYREKRHKRAPCGSPYPCPFECDLPSSNYLPRYLGRDVKEARAVDVHLPMVGYCCSRSSKWLRRQHWTTVTIYPSCEGSVLNPT